MTFKTATTSAFKPSATNIPYSNEYVAEKNRGGVIGGVGYTAEKFGLGFLRAVEGIWDYVAGGIAEAFGAHQWAERQFKNDWVNYNHADEWYNPGAGWKLAGDVAGGIGTTIPAIAVNFIPGIGPAVSAGLTFVTASTSAAGSSVSDAVKQTGSLTGKEWAYGTMSGVTEGLLETATNAIGAGANAVIKSFGRNAAKTVGKRAALKTAGKLFASEAFEEGMSEWLNPYYARATYDPNAKLATPSEVLYSSFVGGLSGLATGGAGAVVNNAFARKSGKNIADRGEADSFIKFADGILADDAVDSLDNETVATLKDVRDKLKASLSETGGKVTTARQQRLLGQLNTLSVQATFNDALVQEAAYIVQNADSIESAISQYKYTDADGNEMNYTAEDLTRGLEVGKNGKYKRNALSNALKNNIALRTLATQSAAGKLLIGSEAFADASLSGNARATEFDFQNFLAKASDTTKSALAKELGVESLDSIGADEFNALITDYMRNGGEERYASRIEKKRAFEDSRGIKATKKIPARINMTSDGIRRFEGNGENIAIEKDGDSYTIYDYTNRAISKPLTKDELNAALKQYARTVSDAKKSTQSADNVSEVYEVAQEQNKAESTEENGKNAVKEPPAKEDAGASKTSPKTRLAEAASMAKESVKGYDALSERNKAMVRKVIRDGRAKGVSDDVVIAFANVSARAKIDVVWDSTISANAYYDPHSERIVANPKKQSGDDILIHELDHALRKTVKGGKVTTKIYERAIKATSEDTYKRIIDKYDLKARDDVRGKLTQGSKTAAERAEIAADEANAYFAQNALGNKDIMKHLLSEKPSLKERILDFFKGAVKDYQKVPKLERQAARYYKQFKKWFDDFAAERTYKTIDSTSFVVPTDAVRFNLAYADTHLGELEKKYSAEDAVMPLADIKKQYDTVLRLWNKLGGELDSEFMRKWNSEKGKDRVFTLFKAQQGYKYNIELSTMCKKGVPLFEAIDYIVRQEITKELESPVISKQHKEILYDLLKAKGFEIPCAICYVEQARQREGAIIDAFLNGKEKKLGWNSTLDTIEREMAKRGVAYAFPKASRDITSTAYTPATSEMTESEQKVFYEVLREMTNAEIERYNEEDRKKGAKRRIPLENTTPEEVSKKLKGTLGSNLTMFKVLFTENGSRMRFDDDMLYSSATTQNISAYHPAFYTLFNTQGGVSGYKTKQGTAVYWGDVLTKNGKTWIPSALRREGGIRNQSNSDFQMYTFLDQVQMYLDLTARGFYLHAYTKTLTELKLFGLSGAKLNASLIPKVVLRRNADGSVNVKETQKYAGLDENMNPIYDDVEGIPHEEAFMLLADDAYSKNVAGICIGYSDAHIFKLLDDNRIQLIIGFHDKTNDGTKRYAGARYAKNYNGENETILKNGKTEHVAFNKFVLRAESKFNRNEQTNTFTGTYTFKGKTYKVNDIPRLAADMYLDECARKGSTPAYNTFKEHPNYYKLLADFGLYDSRGRYAPHSKVAFRLPSTVPYLDANGNRASESTEAFIKRELAKELTVRDEIAAALADRSEGAIIPEYIRRVNALTSTEDVSFSLEDTDNEYLSAVESGDMETAQRMVDEAAKKAGFPVRVLHGTQKFGFTVPDTSLSDDKLSFFATSDVATAKTYSSIGGTRGISEDANYDDIDETYGEHEEAARDAAYELADRISRWAGYYDFVRGRDLHETLGGIAERYENGYITEDQADQEMYEYLDEAIANGYSEDSYDGQEFAEWQESEEADKIYTEAGKTISAYLSLAAFGRNSEKSGNYDLYANTDGFLVIEGNGKKWNNLKSDLLPDITSEQYKKYGYRGHWDKWTTRSVSKYASDNGYRGVLFRNIYDDGGKSHSELRKPADVYSFFYPQEQVKSADPVTYDDNGKVIPISKRFDMRNPDIRRSVDLYDDAETAPTLAPETTVGELRQKLANSSRYRVYSKAKIVSLVKNFSVSDMLSQKTQNEIADSIWQSFNSASRSDIETYSRDVAEFIMSRTMRESKVERTDADYTEASERLAALRTYIGRVTFTEADRAEIRKVADSKGEKSILGRWGYKGERRGGRIPMDVFVTDVAREVPGMAHLEDMHPADAFLEIDTMYQDARKTASDKWENALFDASDAELEAVTQGIADEIISAYETEGKKTEFATKMENILDRAKRSADFWKAEHDKSNKLNRYSRIAEEYARRLKDIKNKTFANSTQYEDEALSGCINKLSTITYRGVLSLKKLASAMDDISSIYSSKDFMENVLLYKDEENSGLYSEYIKQTLDYFTSKGDFHKSPKPTDKALTVEGYKALIDVMSYFETLQKNYKKVWRNDQRVDALPLAKKYVEIANRNEGLKGGAFFKFAGSKYAKTFFDPASLVRRMDYYDDGFFTNMFEDLRRGLVKAKVLEMETLEEYENFIKEHKGYIEGISSKTVKLRGFEIPISQVLDLYMTSKRWQAQAGLAVSGFQYTDLKGKTVSVPGRIDKDSGYSNKDVLNEIAQLQSDITALLTDNDKAYIKLVEDIYNRKARTIKMLRDYQKFGFSNVQIGYYYPITRVHKEGNVDNSMKAEMDRVSNASFNKDTKKGAKQSLILQPVDNRLRRHVKGVCNYHHISPVVDSFNMLFNIDIGGNPNDPTSVSSATKNTWKDGFEYFRKLMSDAQGVSSDDGLGRELLEGIRGAYATSVLALNPKVLATQLSSVASAMSVLDLSSVKGLSTSAADVEKYCKLAKLRKYENTAAYAQAVIDRDGIKKGVGGRTKSKIKKFNDALMKPISWMDSASIGRIFGMCQYEVEAKQGYKIGTEKNKIEAGKLLQETILETQQNTLSTERSAAMRSSNEFYKGATMFSADAMKLFGRFIDGFGEVEILKARMKAEGDASTKAELANKLRTARKKKAKAIASMVTVSIYMVGVARLFSWLKGYDREEDENVVGSITTDFFSNAVGGLPVFKDIYSFVAEGYQRDDMLYSGMYNMAQSYSNLGKTVWGSMSDEASYQDVLRSFKNATFATSSMLGIPAKNLYNYTYGAVKRISPNAAYKWDAAFYEKNYKSDLSAAIEAEEYDKAVMIYEMLIGKQLGSALSAKSVDSLSQLVKSGYKVTPRDVGNTLTIDGEEYLLTDDEKTKVKQSYTSRLSAMESLVQKSMYKAMNDEQKSETANRFFDLCYDVALYDALGYAKNNAVLLAKAIGAENVAIFKTKTKGITSDKDDNGKTVDGSKRQKFVKSVTATNFTKEQKLLLISASGYAIKDGDINGLSAVSAKKQLLKYILSLKIRKAEKERLAEMCGFEVKNGKISLKAK